VTVMTNGLPAPTVCVFTANFASYDSFVEHVPQTVDCDFIIFTDDISAIPTGQLKGIAKIDPGGQTVPVLKNGWLRLNPFEIPELDQYTIVIYIDANVRIVDPAFVESVVNEYYRHPTST
jgi:hypothetical protein